MKPFVAIATVLALVACSTQDNSPSPVPSAASVSNAPSVGLATPATARPSPVEHAPRLVLSMPYASSVEVLGATTGRVGGLSRVGATTFAVDEQERVYVWDRARLRAVVYQAGKFVRAISLPYVEPDARSLLVHGDRLYLRFTGFSDSMEYEIDASTGRLLRAVRLGSSLYPRSRAVDVRVGLPPSGQVTDALGNSYVFDVSTPVQRYLRMHPSGATLAYAVEPLAQKAIDMYARADGALYELASDWGAVGSAYVYALMPPIGAVPVPAAPSAPAAPVAFGGRSVPDQVVATLARAGSVELVAAARAAFWWLASTGVENANNLVTGPSGAGFEARWNDGSRLSISSDGAAISDGTKSYLTPTRVWGQFAGYALASPSRIAQLTVSGTAAVRITDLVGAEHVLTPTELSALRASLATAFSVSEGELPGDLERPFPVYEITVGETVVQLRRDRYAAVSRLGAFAHDGALYELVRRALPVPALSVDDPRSLFLAERVTIEEDGLPSMTGDITRWKASLVRTLTGIESLSNPYPDTKPLTLTFALAGGRTERVRVMANAYTYRGTQYARPGILGIIGYRGVP